MQQREERAVRHVLEHDLALWHCAEPEHVEQVAVRQQMVRVRADLVHERAFRPSPSRAARGEQLPIAQALAPNPWVRCKGFFPYWRFKGSWRRSERHSVPGLLQGGYGHKTRSYVLCTVSCSVSLNDTVHPGARV